MGGSPAVSRTILEVRMGRLRLQHSLALTLARTLGVATLSLACGATSPVLPAVGAESTFVAVGGR